MIINYLKWIAPKGLVPPICPPFSSEFEIKNYLRKYRTNQKDSAIPLVLLAKLFELLRRITAQSYLSVA
jgi:hypothetical protein